MPENLKPRDAAEVEQAIQWAIVGGKTLEIVGRGSKRLVGRAAQWDMTLDLSGLFGVTLAILTLTPGPAFTGIVIAYLLAWSGHFFIEKNRPCAFTHPLWSFASNMRMLHCWLTGEIDPELKSSGVPTE